jgi:hypothetical protein
MEEVRLDGAYMGGWSRLSWIKLMFVRHLKKNHNRNAPLTSDNEDTRGRSSAHHVLSRPCSLLTVLSRCLFRREGRLQWEGLGQWWSTLPLVLGGDRHSGCRCGLATKILTFIWSIFGVSGWVLNKKKRRHEIYTPECPSHSTLLIHPVNHPYRLLNAPPFHCLKWEGWRWWAVEMACRVWVRAWWRQLADPPIHVWVRGRVVVEVGGPNNTSVSCLGAREVPVVIVASRNAWLRINYLDIWSSYFLFVCI